MNEHLNPSELLCAFLDNELDVAETSTLFYALANDQDLQTEMRQLLAMRSAQAPPVAPPDRLRENILALTGLAAPPPVPPHIGAPMNFWRRVFQSRPFLMLASAGIATLVTALAFMMGTGRRMPANIVADSGRSARGAASTGTAAAANAPQRSGSVDSPASAASQVAPTTAGAAGLVSADGEKPNRAAWNDRKHMEHSGGTNASAEPRHTARRVEIVARETERKGMRPQPMDSPARENRQGIAATIAESRPKGIAPTFASPADNGLGAVRPLPSISLPDASSGDDEIDKRLVLELRGFRAQSYPSPDIGPLIEPPVNNFGAGISYTLSRHQEVGIEVGQENFLQEYQSTDSMGRTLYRQNYLALWMVASYGYSFGGIDMLGGIDPFVRGSIGGTGGGPLGKGIVGFRRELGNVALMVGAEGTVLGYRYQGSWLSSRKLGVTYGVSVRF